jgi:hypothetical protein
MLSKTSLVVFAVAPKVAVKMISVIIIISAALERIVICVYILSFDAVV